MQNGRHLLFPVNLNKYTHSCRAWGSNVCVECICELFYTARRRGSLGTSETERESVRLLCTRSMSYTHQHIIRKFYYLFVFRRSMYSRVHLHGRRYEFSTSLPRYAPVIFLCTIFFFVFVARCVLSFVFCRQRFSKTYFSKYHAANTICIIHQDEKRRTAIGSSACDTKCQTAKTQPESCLHNIVFGGAACRATRRNKVYAVCNEISVSA